MSKKITAKNEQRENEYRVNNPPFLQIRFLFF